VGVSGYVAWSAAILQPPSCFCFFGAADCFEPPTLFAGSASELNAVESTRAPQKFAVQYCQRQSSAPLNLPAELECRALRGAMKVHCQTATLRPGRNANDTK